MNIVDKFSKFADLNVTIYYIEDDCVPSEILLYLDKNNVNPIKQSTNKVPNTLYKKNTNSYYSQPQMFIYTNKKDYSKEFFNQIHKLNINNIVLPDNSVCVVYYEPVEKIKKVFWSNNENEEMFSQFV